jgi:hypothetical protein
MRYEQPVILDVDNEFEGVFAASGNDDQEVKRCRNGRREANPGSDLCQVCSVSGGTLKAPRPGESVSRTDYKGCPDGMPEKE